MKDTFDSIEHLLSRLRRIQHALDEQSRREARQLAADHEADNGNASDPLDDMREAILCEELKHVALLLATTRSTCLEHVSGKLQFWLNVSDIDPDHPADAYESLITSVAQDLLLLSVDKAA